MEPASYIKKYLSLCWDIWKRIIVLEEGGKRFLVSEIVENLLLKRAQENLEICSGTPLLGQNNALNRT